MVIVSLFVSLAVSGLDTRNHPLCDVLEPDEDRTAKKEADTGRIARSTTVHRIARAWQAVGRRCLGKNKE